MESYSESPTRLQSPISEDANYDSIYRQASNAFERFLAQQEENQWTPLSAEPTDHEAEGAMLYVMSRGR